MTKIQSRVIRGNEQESEWPPMEPQKDSTGAYYWDSETQEFKEGHPPPRAQRFGQAPYVIGDTIPAYYHPGAEQWTESKGGLRTLDKVSGCFTSDRPEKCDGSLRRRQQRERQDDLHKSMHKAVAQIDAGTAPLTEETKALCAQQNEIVSSNLPGFDAFNAAGRKNDPRGKRFKKPGKL